MTGCGRKTWPWLRRWDGPGWPCTARLRVAVLATGDELRAPGHVLPPGCIHDSNRFFCASLFRGLGFEVTDFGIVPDDPTRIREGLIQAARSHDLVLTSGGVAGGDEDDVVSAVAALGSVASRSIAMKPGKGVPLGDIGGVPFIGLPETPRPPWSRWSWWPGRSRSGWQALTGSNRTGFR